MVDVVDDHGGGQECMPGLAREPVDAQGPQPAPVVQITERLPRQFRGGIEAMVDLAERNRVVRRVAHELLGQEIRVLAQFRQAGLEPVGRTSLPKIRSI